MTHICTRGKPYLTSCAIQKKQQPEDSNCCKRNLGIIGENRAYETQSVNKPPANILRLHCDPLYVRIKKSTF